MRMKHWTLPKALFRMTQMLLFFMMLLATSLWAQDPPQYGTPFAGVPDSRDVNIYQVNIRAFSASRNLQGVIGRLDQIRALGVNVIQLMPIQPVSTERAFNSPYAWRDLKTVGTEYGSLTDLRALIDAAHARGMAVILDWVANQTGWDHPWISQHPEYYRRVNGVIQTLNGWTDVAALDFNSTAMRTEMINAMRYWIFASNCDGFRFDYADNAPIDFWQQAISNLRGITSHRLILYAEGERSANYSAGFDYNFAWHFYFNSMKPIYQSGGAATLINTSNSFEYQGATGNQQSVRWLSNHDVYGTDGSPFNIFGGKNGTLAAFVVSAYMRGIPFIYNGMEVGNTVAIPFPFTSSVINWSQDVSVTPLMTQILAFRNSSNAIRRGSLTTYSNSNVCAFSKVSGTETVLVLSNLRNSSQTFSLPAGFANTTMVDAFTNASVTLGTSITLNAYQYRVFKNGSGSSLTVSPASLSFGSAAGNQTVSVTSNVAWTVTDNQTWITVSPTSGSNNANFVVSATANTGAARSGTVTVTGGGITRTISVSQAAAGTTASLTVSTTSLSVGSGASTSTVSVTSNVSWTTTDNQTWITVAPASGSNNANITVSVTANTGAARSGTVTVAGGGITRTITVSQNAGSSITYYTIRNRWTNAYLYDAGANVGYGTTVANNNYKWEKVVIDATNFWLKNLGTGEYMHIENQTGSVQCTAVDINWWSSQWYQESVDATWIRIRNRWQPASMIHVENQTGSAQYAGAQTTWYSAQWQLSTVTGARLAVREGEDQAITEVTAETYPNPATGKLFYVTITGLEKNEMADLTLRDIHGNMVFMQRVTGSENVEHDLPSGLYIMNVNTKRARIVKKLLITD